MGRTKKEFPPAKEHVIAFRVTDDLYAALSTITPGEAFPFFVIICIIYVVFAISLDIICNL